MQKCAKLRERRSVRHPALGWCVIYPGARGERMTMWLDPAATYDEAFSRANHLLAREQPDVEWIIA